MVDAFDALARNGLCDQNTAIIPKGRQSSLSYSVLYTHTLNPPSNNRAGRAEP